MKNDIHLCPGPDAGQLLGFLCALGLLEVATRSFPHHAVGLGFTWHAVAFRPVLRISPRVKQDALVDSVHKRIVGRASSSVLTELGDDLPCPVSDFERVAREALSTSPHDGARLLAALGVAQPETGELHDTAFRTMSGAGHQRFLGFARRIAEQTTKEQLKTALFAQWSYDDPGPSLRFDPVDDRRYALRGDDPARSSAAPIRTVRAGNALAFEGLALLPVVPTAKGARTTLVSLDGRTLTVRWPVWERTLTSAGAAALLASTSKLEAPGVTAVFEARRLTVGKFRAFTPSRRVR